MNSLEHFWCDLAMGEGGGLIVFIISVFGSKSTGAGQNPLHSHRSAQLHPLLKLGQASLTISPAVCVNIIYMSGVAQNCYNKNQ